MKKRILAITLALGLLLAMVPASAAAADYASAKLGVASNIVGNRNGYAVTATEEEGWSTKHYDPIGRIAFEHDGYYVGATSDGYLVILTEKNIELYDPDFNLVSAFDPYKLVNGDGDTPSETEESGIIVGTGGGYEMVFDGGVIAIVDEPLRFFDYAANPTGEYSEFSYIGDGQVRVGTDGLITITSFDWDTHEYSWAIVDKTGELLTDLGTKYSNIGALYEGLAWAFAYLGGDEYQACYIDKDGNIVIDMGDAYYLFPFYQGYAVYGTLTDDGLRYGAIDKSGETVIAPQYVDLYGWDGIFVAGTGDKFGYIDAAGNVLVPFIYDDLSAYMNNVGYGTINGEIYVIRLGLSFGADEPDDWAGARVGAALASNLVPESVAGAGWRNPASRLAAAQAMVGLIEKILGRTMQEIADENGWDLSDNLFSDTDDPAVSFLRHAKVVQGVGGNEYAPDSNYLRAEVVTMIGKAAEIFLGIEVTGDNPFTDVPDYAVPYVGFAAKNKIVEGVGDGLFGSGANMQNQAIAIINLQAYEVLK